MPSKRVLQQRNASVKAKKNLKSLLLSNISITIQGMFGSAALVVAFRKVRFQHKLLISNLGFGAHRKDPSGSITVPTFDGISHLASKHKQLRKRNIKFGSKSK